MFGSCTMTTADFRCSCSGSTRTLTVFKVSYNYNVVLLLYFVMLEAFADLFLMEGA